MPLARWIASRSWGLLLATMPLTAATQSLSPVAGSGTKGYSGDSGLAMNAQLNTPRGIAADGAGNLYIADSGNHCIRKVTPDGSSASRGAEFSRHLSDFIWVPSLPE